MNDATAITHRLKFDLVPDAEGPLPVRLICGPQVVIGRNKEACDLVTWFLPRNAENDQETRRLSQVHCFLEHEQNFVRIRDADSAAGTFWNQVPVPLGEGQSSPLGFDGRLTLGKHFPISVEWHSGCALLQPVVSQPAFRHCLWLIGARLGFRVDWGRSPWLVPDVDGDNTLCVRSGGLWWNDIRIAPGVSLEGRITVA